MAATIGLYAAGTAATIGTGHIVYIDGDPARREIATALGAEAFDEPSATIGSLPTRSGTSKGYAPR
jgi:threonine dehydrogenase-like Zn-dependent dehydrogenase